MSFYLKINGMSANEWICMIFFVDMQFFFMKMQCYAMHVFFKQYGFKGPNIHERQSDCFFNIWFSLGMI